MIKDFLISFRDNFKEKTRNPFLGTYLIVWAIRNWELVFTIFNFDDDYKLEDKINFVKSYYEEHNFLTNILITILWTFGLIILTYLLLAMTRFITNLSEKQLIPIIYKITDSKSIVLKEKYDQLKLENSRIESQLDKERENKKRLFSEITDLEKTIDELNSNRQDSNESQEKNSKALSLENEVVVLFNKIKNKNLIEEFINLSNSIGIDEPGWIKNEDITNSSNYFAKLGLIYAGKDNGNYSQMDLTDIGQKVLRRSRLEID